MYDNSKFNTTKIFREIEDEDQNTDNLPTNSKQEENLIFKNYLQNHNIKSNHQRKYTKDILCKLIAIFQNQNGMVTPLRSISIRMQVITEVTNIFIKLFVPSLQYSTLQYCDEWKALIHYHCPVIHRHVISNLNSADHFVPVCFYLKFIPFLVSNPLHFF